MKITPNSVHCGDALELLQAMPDASVDLVFYSPPYGKQRSYGELDFKLTGEDFVAWSVEVYRECYRVSKGLTACVIEGATKHFVYDATPILIAADLKRAGVKLRKPPIFHRFGIPGSGGPDWLRNDYEFIICASHGKLPWSDNTACGHPPKFPPGGAPSHQSRDGRVNKPRPQREGDVKRSRTYKPPTKSNPGNVQKFRVGGSAMGSPLAHENEAPFPEALADFYIRSFCPPGGIVLDPFSGSGTTAAAAIKADRQYIAFDLRESQTELTRRRINEANIAASGCFTK